MPRGVPGAASEHPVSRQSGLTARNLIVLPPRQQTASPRRQWAIAPPSSISTGPIGGPPWPCLVVSGCALIVLELANGNASPSAPRRTHQRQRGLRSPEPRLTQAPASLTGGPGGGLLGT